jgi:hypothetical protein
MGDGNDDPELAAKVDSHQAVAPGVTAVEAVDGVDDIVDRLAGELVAKDIDRDLLVGGGEGADGAGDPLDRARVAEDVPGSEALEDDLPPAGPEEVPEESEQGVSAGKAQVEAVQQLEP